MTINRWHVVADSAHPDSNAVHFLRALFTQAIRMAGMLQRDTRQLNLLRAIFKSPNILSVGQDDFAIRQRDWRRASAFPPGSRYGLDETSAALRAETVAVIP